MSSNREEILKEIKPTKKGAFVVFLLLIFFPLLIDGLLLSGNITKMKTKQSMAGMLTDHYVKLLPFFIGYIIVALLAIHLFNKLRIKL